MERSAPVFILQVNQVGIVLQHDFYSSVRRGVDKRGEGGRERISYASM